MKKMLIAGLVALFAAVSVQAGNQDWSGGNIAPSAPSGIFAGGTYGQTFVWDAERSPTNDINSGDIITAMYLPANCLVFGATVDVQKKFLGSPATNSPAYAINVGYNTSTNDLFSQVSLTNAATSAVALAPYNQVTRVITNAVYGGGAITGNVTVVESASIPKLTSTNGTPVRFQITGGDDPYQGKLKIHVLYMWLGEK